MQLTNKSEAAAMILKVLVSPLHPGFNHVHMPRCAYRCAFPTAYMFAGSFPHFVEVDEAWDLGTHFALSSHGRNVGRSPSTPPKGRADLVGETSIFTWEVIRYSRNPTQINLGCHTCMWKIRVAHRPARIAGLVGPLLLFSCFGAEGFTIAPKQVAGCRQEKRCRCRRWPCA